MSTAVTGKVTSVGKLYFALERGHLSPASITVQPGTYSIRLDNGYVLGTAIPLSLNAQPTTAQSAAGGAAALGTKLVANTLPKSSGRSQLLVTLAQGTYTLVVGANSEWKATITVTPSK